MSWVQQFFATSGLSRLATLQALGGFMMLEPLPEMSQRLLPASSQANTSGGLSGISFLKYSSAARVSAELILMLSLASTNWAPNEGNSAPTQSIASVVCPIGSPTGKPALCSCSAVLRYVSQVQVAAVVGRENLRHVDAAVLLIKIDARAARLDLAADHGRDAAPYAVVLGEIF